MSADGPDNEGPEVDGSPSSDWSYARDAATDPRRAADPDQFDEYEDRGVGRVGVPIRVGVRPTRRKLSDRLGKWFAPVLFLGPILVIAGILLLWWQRQLDPPGAPGRAVSFVVTEKMNTKDIADALDERGIIGSSFVFQMYAKTADRGPFQQGTFVLRENEGVRGAAEILEGKAANPLVVGLLRGLRVELVAKQLAAQIPGTTTSKFLEVARSGEVRSRFQPDDVDSLEGFLAPDQYTMPRGISERDALQAIVDNFDKVATKAGIKPTRAGYEQIILASLLEKEAARNDERATIAGVMKNRLNDGTLLQLDATVLYAIGRDTGFTTDKDRAVDSPYNTYQVAGLPPTPIANVSVPSLRAALKPATTKFLFYVFKDCDGRHAFAETFAQHVRNVEAARAKGLFDDACSS